MGLGLHVLAPALAHQPDRDLDEVAHDLFDVAADIADLGELGGLDLQERRVGEPGEAAGDLGLAAAGRPDHQDVLRRDLLAQRPVELLPAPAVAQRDGDGALGVVLADDEAVEFGDDLAGGKAGHWAGGAIRVKLHDHCGSATGGNLSRRPPSGRSGRIVPRRRRQPADSASTSAASPSKASGRPRLVRDVARDQITRARCRHSSAPRPAAHAGRLPAQRCRE